MKIPPQRNNISSSVNFLKIALLKFFRKKNKKERIKIFNGSLCHNYDPETLSFGYRQTLQFLCHMSFHALWFPTDLLFPCSLYGMHSSNAIIPLPVEIICTLKIIYLIKMKWCLKTHCLASRGYQKFSVLSRIGLISYFTFWLTWLLS